MTGGKDPLLVYGVNEAGVEIAEAAAAGGWTVLGLLDEYTDHAIATRLKVFRDFPQGHEQLGVIIAIDHNMARRRILADLAQPGITLVNIIHPSAWVSPTAILGQGVYVGAHAVIQPGAVVDTGTLIGAYGLVGHGAHVFPFSRIDSRAAVGSRAMVGALSTIGMGATVLPGAHVLQDTQVEPGQVIEPDPGNAGAFEAA